jgi:hypothetical protein
MAIGGHQLGEDLAEAGVAASPRIAIARYSITARWAMLLAISGCWTGRF